MIEKKVEDWNEDIISSTCELIAIPSIHSESNVPGMPFGKNCADALAYVLTLGEKLGFRSKNMDGYCGYLEFGEGEELVGIIGHLDVVPAGDSWTYSPFSGSIKNGNLYGRGAIDDKGPVIACLYAMKAVMDTCHVSKRVRLILGLNEERDWECIHYYTSHEEIPTVSFSPDADFPCIYAEKALLNIHLESSYVSTSPIKIISVDCKGNAMNVVPNYCSVLLEVVTNECSISSYLTSLEKIGKSHSFEITIETLDDSHFQITSYGKLAHAAHPDLGINAISNLLVVLHEFLSMYNASTILFEKFYQFLHTQYTGFDLGIACQDESGALSLNISRLTLENAKFTLSMNLRIPVTTPIATVKKQVEEKFTSLPITVFFDGEKEALYVSKEDPLVQKLCHIFNEVTNSNVSPIAIGGATYARAFPNCISFGPNFPQEEDRCHKKDEFISIEHLLLCAKIYAKAIEELGQ